MNNFQVAISNILSQFGHWELFVRLVIACVCGGLIGLERSVRRKNAGLKTHIILAMGSALFMIVSQYGFEYLNLAPEYRADASRIASNIVTGVSFLCAGVIFVRGGSVKGLTTATGIWATAGIGMAAGAGMYAITFFATALVLIIYLLLSKLSTKLESYYLLEVELLLDEKSQIKDAVNTLSAITKSHPTNVKISKKDGANKVTISINTPNEINEMDLLHKLSQNAEVLTIHWSVL